MKVNIEQSWKEKLSNEFNKPYFEILTTFVRNEYKRSVCYPPAQLIFNAFNTTPFYDVKVVIIGQDPYHEQDQAMGLCFSVQSGIRTPPSLQNIFKELNDDLGINANHSSDLTHWAKQGVLMLNASLTVRSGAACSHQSKGWEEFTDAAIQALIKEHSHLVFILWGNYAQRKAAFVDNKKHLILKSAHPSPLSANRGGFFGTKPFSKTNEYLQKHGKTPIQW